MRKFLVMILLSSLAIALPVASATAACSDLIAPIQTAVDDTTSTVSDLDRTNARQMLEEGISLCDAGDEAGATSMLEQAMDILGL